MRIGNLIAVIGGASIVMLRSIRCRVSPVILKGVCLPDDRDLFFIKLSKEKKEQNGSEDYVCHYATMEAFLYRGATGNGQYVCYVGIQHF